MNTEYRPGEQDYPLFDYSGLDTAAASNSNQQQTWKYTEQPSTAATPTTKDWHQFVNNKGITNWEDHLRSQGIDPQVIFMLKIPGNWPKNPPRNPSKSRIQRMHTSDT